MSRAERHRRGSGRALLALATVPILLVGTVASRLQRSVDVSTGRHAKLGQAPDSVSEAEGRQPPSEAVLIETSPTAAVVPAGTAPERSSAPPAGPPARGASRPTPLSELSYRVELGDTVSEIAIRHGLSTAHVLARNGLSWKTPIFPGQVLRLGPPPAADPRAEPPEGPAHPSS